jgi:hypothetical protein
MSCREMNEILDRHVSPATLPAAASAHLEACPKCRAVYSVLTQPPETPIAGELQARLEGAITASLRPVKPLPSAGVLLAALLAVFAAVTAAGILAMGVEGAQVMTALQLGGLGMVLVLGATALATLLARQMVPGSRHPWRPEVVLLVAAGSLLTGIALLFPWMTEARLLGRGWTCGAAGLLLAVPAWACLWRLVRRGFLVSPGWTGATAGLLAGLTGATALHFGCFRVDAAHLVVWHAGVPVLGALAGCLVAKALMRRNSFTLSGEATLRR